MTAKILAAILAGGLLVSTSAFAADFDVPIELPGGSVLLQKVQRTVTTTKDGKSDKTDAAYALRLEVEPTQSGEYKVRQTMTDAPAGQPVRPVVAFEADASLNPEPAAAEAAKEQALISLMQAAALFSGVPVEGNESISAFGATVSSYAKAELLSLDKAAGRAVIHFRTVMNGDSAKGAMQAASARLPTRLSVAQLAALKPERITDCRHDMDMKTGLATKVDCTVTATVSDTLQDQTTVEHYVITQQVAGR